MGCATTLGRRLTAVDEDDGAEEDDMWGIARDMPTGFHQVHHIHHHHQHAFGARANDWIFNRGESPHFCGVFPDRC